ncbi:Doublecortin domain-containing protein [Aphelenchoides bicaudatus]|nr:Doublecortin domain-containing protein [Aphelenchoides bicaudatus]
MIRPRVQTPPDSAEFSTSLGTASRSFDETPDPLLREIEQYKKFQAQTSYSNASSVAPPRIPPRHHLQRSRVHQSGYLPDVPAAPVNGMIKTYGTEHRTFTRPHSAKTVFFYKDNDIYYTGLRVPVSKARYRTIDSLLDRLNDNISLPFGVRHLHTPHGRTPIKSLDQLEHLGK